MLAMLTYCLNIVYYIFSCVILTNSHKIFSFCPIFNEEMSYEELNNLWV